jgi:O-methyltransferase
MKLKEFSLANFLLRRKTFAYPFMFTPQQLVFLADCVERAVTVPGCIVEAGCAYGATTVFLNMFMRDIGCNKPYVAIDTFSGFKPEHVAYEVSERGKPKRLGGAFSRNDKSWLEYSLKAASIGSVRIIQGDVTTFDFASLGPIAFCLLDVDLYIPIRDSLPKILAGLSPGGTIVVDDCRSANNWDGALQAYQEFCAARGSPEEIVCGKLGLVRKLAA